jgi:hypothetical protein
MAEWQSDELKQLISKDARADTLAMAAIDIGVGRDTVNNVATDAFAASRLTKESALTMFLRRLQELVDEKRRNR